MQESIFDTRQSPTIGEFVVMSETSGELAVHRHWNQLRLGNVEMTASWSVESFGMMPARGRQRSTSLIEGFAIFRDGVIHSIEEFDPGSD
tara:strand:+ start:239 stop:508 length:270 start_codon:yes stop_codon:yes gene_type:complete